MTDERGGLTGFVLVFFVLMLVVGGMAVDYQRYELARSDLQNALDRGILAATNGEQTYDQDGESTLDEQAAEVIYDYVASRIDRGHLVEVAASVTELAGGRSVVATASRQLDTIFLHMINITQFDVNVRSAAMQAAPKLEIALVLDVSGSMGWNSTSSPGTKLARLKVAAKEFLDIILSEQNDAETLISIVPFSQQVNMPRAMADVYNLTRHHNYSNCFAYQSLNFATTAMPTAPQTAYLQSQHFRENVGSGNFGCPKAANAIMPYSNDVNALKAAIDGLSPETWTATYMGMKWGSVLLDPSSRPVVTAMINAGTLSSDFAGWPNAWSDRSVRKVTIVMSDGQNTKLNGIRESIYSNFSTLYWNLNLPTGSQKIAVIDSELTGQGDVILNTICDQAKVGINSTVYTIGFELQDEPVARAALENCSSSVSTHYLVEGVEISTAFRLIAGEIVQLKLTN